MVVVNDYRFVPFIIFKLIEEKALRCSRRECKIFCVN